jgi:hypothetical protein
MPIYKSPGGTGPLEITGTVSGPGAGVQYVAGTEGVSTGTGTLFIGVNVDTAVPIKVDANGVVSVSGGGGGVQYTIDTTTIAATGTGTIFLGINATTVKALAIGATGGVSDIINVQTVQTVDTLLGTIAISGTVDGTFGGGQQYTVETTALGATGTGTLFLGINSTTVEAIRVSADGTVFVSPTGTSDVSITNTPTVTVATNLGTVVISGTANIAPMYSIGATTIAATGTGFLMVGKQSGATTARGWVFTTTGAGHVNLINNPTVTISTGTVNVVSTPAVSGSVSVINTPTVTVSTGTVHVVNTPTVTVTPNPLPIIQTHIATQWNGFVTLTTSAVGGGILKTSAGNTVYVTDVWISVDVPMNIELRTATTAKAKFFFATKGGMVAQLKSPLICTTAQSFTVRPLASGSMSAFAAGYTVT